MKRDEDWVAEQTRLLALEDGFGPAYVADRRGNAAAVTDDAEAASLRSSSA
jgi:hypothetical protein